MRMMREGVQNVKNEMKGTQIINPDEKALHRKAQYIDAKWDQLTEVSRAVSRPLHCLSVIYCGPG